MLTFQMPNITREQVANNRTRFEVEPLDRGFGHTFGNALRRVLLSSLEGAAVSSVKIEGVSHEFSTLPGLKEDVTDVILNLKGIICRLHGEPDEVQVRLVKDKPGKVVAADIDVPAELEILNPDHYIASLSGSGAIEMTLTIRRGTGYVSADGNKGPETVIGVMPIDSIFSPIKRVSYIVESARVGQRTDYDKLIVDVVTNGAITPEEALRQAAEILVDRLQIFTDPDRQHALDEFPIEGVGGDRRRRHGRRADRRARARRAFVQLSQARGHPDGRRPRHQDRSRASEHPQLRQEEHRRGQRQARRAWPVAAG